MIPKLYTAKEAAEFLHISIPTIYRFLSNGKIGSIKSGGKRFFTEEHINTYIKQNETTAYVSKRW